MTSTYAVVGAFALAHTGMACLALAGERLSRQLRPHGAPFGQCQGAWRIAGAVSLALSLSIGVLAWGAGNGVAIWCGMLSAVALPLILMITYAPARTFMSALIAVSVGLPCLLAVLVQASPA